MSALWASGRPGGPHLPSLELTLPDSEIDDLLDSTIEADDESTLELLGHGHMDVLGHMPYSSNATFLVTVDDGSNHTQAIYKPEAGERPLWDFPPGLWRREVGAYQLAVALGWSVVPPTVVRRDAPRGVGSVQYFVPAHYSEHYFTLRDQPTHRRTLEQICLLDIVANNTDRKGGHCLLGRDERVWAIDNGLSFHSEFKLRTVIWDFAGEAIPDDLLEDLRRVAVEAPAELAELLDPSESAAVLERARALVEHGRFPTDPTGRLHPWPLV
ncbi:MAG: SCO1664 family protein [Microthrixaceae bacterium]|nr:SCO1664 family protein [Microthrixaceae bacterium]